MDGGIRQASFHTPGDQATLLGAEPAAASSFPMQSWRGAIAVTSDRLTEITSTVVLDNPRKDRVPLAF